MDDLTDEVILITGSTRGIGRAIAMRCAALGARVVITGKTVKPHKTLPGTIFSTADEINSIGGQALAIEMDVREDTAIKAAVKAIIAKWGRIDKLVNNASAIVVKNTENLPMRKFDLMMSCNVRATFACSQACLPHLLQADNPHILNLAPPLNLDPLWLKDFTAYTISKYGMSMCTLGMAAEFKDKIAVNALWPKTTIGTMAVKVHFPDDVWQGSRTPNIMSDAAALILAKDCTYTGQFLIDEDILRASGVSDFSPYAINPDMPLQNDFFV